MKPNVLLIIATVLIFLFGVGHTIGHFTRKQTTDPVDKEVIRQMEQHKFNVSGSMRSWDDFYEALSLDVSLVLAVFTVMFSMLSGMTKKYPSVCYTLLWPFLICFIGFTITSLCFVFIIPGVMSSMICMVIIAAMIQLRRPAP